METPLAWRKSSYSSGRGENCVEVAPLPLGAAMRDSKHPQAGHLAFSVQEWAVFVSSLKDIPEQ